jgi:hypothetical protein
MQRLQEALDVLAAGRKQLQACADALAELGQRHAFAQAKVLTPAAAALVQQTPNSHGAM